MSSIKVWEVVDSWEWLSSWIVDSYLVTLLSHGLSSKCTQRQQAFLEGKSFTTVTLSN